MRGLVLLAPEGINGTVCGSPGAVAAWKSLLTEQFGPMRFNDSEADKFVFPRWSVKVKKEIVTIKDDAIVPDGHGHLSPKEWEAMLQEEGVVVIDARNDYEYRMGAFRGAINPATRHFSEFPEFVKNSGIPKDKKIMMYCTGGIRCDKAIMAMKQQGYADVHQLSGGILGYLKEFPNGSFEGECFVFDHRVGVDQHLRPSSQYGLCPHCGDPAQEHITCARCNRTAVMCTQCCAKGVPATCSKNCRNQLMRQAVGRAAV